MQILTIAGNVGKDAVLRRQDGHDPVLNFSIAVDNGKDKDGQSRTATWFDCSIWGKRAEALEKHITKGIKLAVSGKPSARAHDGKAYLGITINDLTFQGGSQGGEDRGESRPSDGASQSPTGGYSGGGVEDDLPFAPQVD